MVVDAAHLLSWSDAAVASHGDPASTTRLFYPSVAGEDADPQLPGRSFYLYFLLREPQPTAP